MLLRGPGLVAVIIVTVLRIFLFFRRDMSTLYFMTFFLEQAGSVSKVKNCYSNKG